MVKGEVVEYTASPTLSRFHQSDAFIRVLRGPVGSGKSTACAWEIWRRASQQAKAANGKRLSAFVVIRNSYRELKDTTLATFLDWFSEARVGSFNYSAMEHRIEYGDLDCLILFRSLDKPQDVRKLLSLELTGAWINEARETPRIIVNRLAERVGRYPPPAIVKPTWFGIWADTNPPDEDHWLAEAERNPPEGWEFFQQPGGLIKDASGKWVVNPKAENIQFLPPDYYTRNLGAMKEDEIRVYRGNLHGFVVDGKPVTPEFNPTIHVSPDIRPIDNEPLRIGLDVGGGTLNPAAVFFQRTPRGNYIMLAECVCSEMGIEACGRTIKNVMSELFPEHLSRLEQGGDDVVLAYGDPAGRQRDQLYETVVFEHLYRAAGFPVRAAPSQDQKLRIDALRAPMQRMIDGKPGFLVHPRCRQLVKALQGGWAYKRLAVSGTETYADKPDKGPLSHVGDAACYGLLGAGEMRTLQAAEVQPIRRPMVARQARWVV